MGYFSIFSYLFFRNSVMVVASPQFMEWNSTDSTVSCFKPIYFPSDAPVILQVISLWNRTGENCGHQYMVTLWESDLAPGKRILLKREILSENIARENPKILGKSYERRWVFFPEFLSVAVFLGATGRLRDLPKVGASEQNHWRFCPINPDMGNL